jgi:hypothetical protein
LSGTEISNNTAVGYGSASSGTGGGVYLNTGNFTMSGGTIYANYAGYNGGGLFQNGGTLTLNGGTIDSNTANNNGGGLYVGFYNATLSGTTISGNSATYGGGIYVISGYELVQTSGTVSGNTADYGAGVAAFGTFTLTGGTIGGTGAGNTATNYGGGVYVDAAGTFNLNSGTITGNIATLGQGAYADWTSGTTYPIVVTPTSTSVINAPDIIYLNGDTTSTTGARIDLNTTLTSSIMATTFAIQVANPATTRTVALATNPPMAAASVTYFKTWLGASMVASTTNINYNATQLDEE